MNLFAFLIGLWMIAQSQTPAPIPILFWHFYGDDRAAIWQDMADEFNASQNAVSVTVQYFPAYPQQHDAILSALIHGGLPDVALAYPYDAELYNLGGAVLDQNQPFVTQVAALFINEKSLIGLGYQAPQTRAELAEIACAYTKMTSRPAVYVPLNTPILLAMSAPLDIFDGQRFNLRGGALRDTLAFWADLLRRGCAALNPADDGMTAFASEQTLFYFADSEMRFSLDVAIRRFFAEPFAVLMRPIPSQDGAATVWGGLGYVLFRSDVKREAAAQAWLDWLSQSAQRERWREAAGDFPRVAADSDFAAAVVVVEPTFAGYDLVRDELVFAARAILAGENVEVRLGALETTANQIYQAFLATE